MESLRTSRKSAESDTSTSERQRPGAIVDLHMRLWSYGGPQGKLTDLFWTQDPPVTELVHDVVHEGQGKVVEEYASSVVAEFSDPLHALSTAKFLQLRLLTLHRHAPAGQVVAAIMVEDQSAARLQGSGAMPPLPFRREILRESNSAQILVTEKVRDLAKNIPGFEFTSKPAHESAEGTSLGTLYELLWTDESTYGHLRKTSEGAPTEPKQQRRYTIQSELGRGCMGIVYKAYDEVIGRPVALKTIAVNHNFPNRNELVERLKQEAKAAGSLDHPNIITIFDVGEEEDLVYLSMQLLEGKTLATVLNEGNLAPLPTLLTYADQILSAVSYAHKRGVIHRDLKPANFMLTSQGMIKILDFGIAKIEDASLTQAGMIVGTPTYMAPEQARAKKVDQRSDIFSLGSVFYELFTRERPFKGDVTTVLYKLIHEDPVPPSVINPALPVGIDAIIRKALSKQPADRYQSCEEMRVALQEQAALLKDVPAAPGVKGAKAKPVTVEDLLEEVKPRRRRRGSVWFALAASIVLAATAVGVWAMQVKVSTGSFPPTIERLLVALHVRSQSSEAKAPQQVSGSQTVSTPAPAGTSNSLSSTAANEASSSAASATSSQPVTGAPPTPAPTSADNNKDQGSANSSSAAAAAGDESSSASDSGTAQPGDEDPFKPRKRPEKATSANDNVRVEGFTRHDVPMLLTKADAATGRGDYSLAKYEYNLILKLDRSNATARAGLRRVTAAEQDQAKQ